jgi:hypothetical protein
MARDLGTYDMTQFLLGRASISETDAQVVPETDSSPPLFVGIALRPQNAWYAD